MVDFLISQSGDLVFEKSATSQNRLEISFYKSNAKTLIISFETETHEVCTPSDQAMTVHIGIADIEYNKNATMVAGYAFLKQQINMRLKTSLGELSERPNIGSKLETIMHSEISDIAIQNKIKAIVSESISDLLSDFTVQVVPKVRKSNNKYEQCMMVYIYTNDSLITSYKVG